MKPEEMTNEQLVKLITERIGEDKFRFVLLGLTQERWEMMENLLKTIQQAKQEHQRLSVELSKKMQSKLDECIHVLLKNSTPKVLSQDIDGKYYYLNEEDSRTYHNVKDSIMPKDILIAKLLVQKSDRARAEHCQSTY